eukprot:2694851-Rhodomonas_salina.3
MKRVNSCESTDPDRSVVEGSSSGKLCGARARHPWESGSRIRYCHRVAPVMVQRCCREVLQVVSGQPA